MHRAVFLLLLPATAALLAGPASPALRRPALVRSVQSTPQFLATSRTQPPIMAARSSEPTMAAATSFKSSTARGYLCVLGGLMAHLILGTVYCLSLIHI